MSEELVLYHLNMPAYLYPISGTSKLIPLQQNVYIFGRGKAPPYQIVIKEFERSVLDDSDYPQKHLVMKLMMG